MSRNNLHETKTSPIVSDRNPRSHSKSIERSISARKERAPIIVTKEETFSYKAPSSIHETVVHTLRKEKDNLQIAL